MSPDNGGKVAVVGAGTMGNGIAHIFAQSGFDVTIIDVEASFLDKALAVIDKNLSRQVKKGVIDEDAKGATLGRITKSTSLDDAAGAFIVIEAVTEDETVKAETFKKLDGVASADAILASNTSSIPITRLAAYTSRPEKVIGMHFMNPVPMMKLCEIVR
jgi:3-hydroxybutyryl-CoA dehydrogenase